MKEALWDAYDDCEASKEIRSLMERRVPLKYPEFCMVLQRAIRSYEDIKNNNHLDFLYNLLREAESSK